MLSIIERWQGGTVADLTDKPPSIRKDKSVPLGVFLVAGAAGEVEIVVKDQRTGLRAS